MQLVQSPERLIPLTIRKYASFCVAENVVAVVGGNEVVVHVQALPKPFVFAARCQSPQECAISTLNSQVAVVHHTSNGNELGLFSWSMIEARKNQEHASRLTLDMQVSLSGKPASSKCLAFSDDEAFLVCLLLNDVLIYEVAEQTYVRASSIIYICRQDDFFCTAVIKRAVLSSGARVYAAILGCKNQTVMILPFKYSREENAIIVSELRPLIHLAFVPAEIHCDSSHFVCNDASNIAMMPYKQSVSVSQKDVGPELSIKMFADQQIPLSYFPGARKIFTSGMGLFMDSLSVKGEQPNIADMTLATILFIDTDVGVFGVSMNSVAPVNVALAERSDSDPDSLETCLDKECITTYSVLSSLFEHGDGRNHYYLVEASNRKLYIFQSRLIATGMRHGAAAGLANLSIGYAPTPKSYSIVFSEFGEHNADNTWILPVTSVLNPGHPRLVQKGKCGAASAGVAPWPSQSQGAGTAHSLVKKSVSAQAPRNPSAGAKKVRSSGYSTSMPWSEQQKLKLQRARQDNKGKQLRRIDFVENAPDPMAALALEDEFLKRYSHIKSYTMLSIDNPVLYAQALDDGSFAYLSGDNCISFYTKVTGDKQTSLKLKLSIVPSARTSMFSVHPSSQIILTPGPNASVGLWRTTASNRKEILTCEPRRKVPHETSWCSFVWPRSDVEGLCLSTFNNTLCTFQYNLFDAPSENALRDSSTYTELALLDLPQVIFSGACFTRFKSPVCFLTHSKADKTKASDLLSIVDIARMKKVAVINSDDSPHTKSPSVFLPDFAYTNIGSLSINMFATSASGMTSGEVTLYDVRQELLRPVRLFKGVTAIKANPKVTFLPKCNGLAVSGDDGRILVYDIRSSGVVFDSSTLFKTHSLTGGFAASNSGTLIGGCHDGKLYMVTL